MKSYFHNLFKNDELRIEEDVLVAEKTRSIAPPVLPVQCVLCPLAYSSLSLTFVQPGIVKSYKRLKPNSFSYFFLENNQSHHLCCQCSVCSLHPHLFAAYKRTKPNCFSDFLENNQLHHCDAPLFLSLCPLTLLWDRKTKLLKMLKKSFQIFFWKTTDHTTFAAGVVCALPPLCLFLSILTQSPPSQILWRRKK